MIEVKNLEKIYGDGEVTTPALRDISFIVEPGEFIAVMGPSGSGKSTLLHILGFLDRQTSGIYRFEGKTIDDYSKDEIARTRNKKMGFVFQAFNLLARTSVLENVKLPLVYSGIKQTEWDAMAMEVIESMGLTKRIKHEPSQLSGGERQRVAIARALVNNPSVIFLDEPTGNLDSKSGRTVMEIIQKLSEEEKRTIILITHENSTAEYAKRTIRLLDGRIVSDEKVANRRDARDFIK
ncbi:MAG: ABC transporter ATP-binding protein [bacterium]|nr:ABC transporter ATP-binding protein [bacterium]